jgi:hypothetical protein
VSVPVPAAAVDDGLGVVALAAVLVSVEGAVLAVGAVVVVLLAAAGAAVVSAAVLQFLLVALPPRLPALMALPVAVQPAPGVELLVASLDDDVPVELCARAVPPTTRAAAVARVANMLFFITDISL